MAPSRRHCELDGRLFPDSPPFKLVKLGESAARKQIDELKILEGMLLESEPMYPTIGRWYREKVLPGLKTSERVAYLAYEGERPVASAVLKFGEHAKFCHVRILENFRDLNLGRMIFTEMAFRARHQKNIDDIHFTLPENLWNESAGFFASFGFDTVVRSPRQYRSGEDELYCSAPIGTVWKHARENLHLLAGFSPGGFSIQDKVLLSMHPKYAELVLSGKKEIEIRRKFSRKLKGKRAVLYGTQPLGSLMGEVTLGEIIPGTPGQIWNRYGSKVGCNYEEFAAYVGDSKEVFALELTNQRPYLSPVSLPQLSQLIQEELRPPQSFLHVRIDQSSPWGKAIAVTGLLHA